MPRTSIPGTDPEREDKKKSGGGARSAPQPEAAVQDQGNQPEKEVSDHDG